MRNFKELNIWEDAMAVAADSYTLCKLLPAQERYNLVSQIQRASVSVPTNIAEGCSRSSQKDFKRFIEIGLGSCFETETLLLLTGRIYPGIQPQSNALLGNLYSLEKQMTRFYQNIRV